MVVPPPGRVKVLALLHESHPGVARMKGMARSYVWWPGMDAELEERVKQCNQCQQHHKLPRSVHIQIWSAEIGDDPIAWASKMRLGGRGVGGEPFGIGSGSRLRASALLFSEPGLKIML